MSIYLAFTYDKHLKYYYQLEPLFFNNKLCLMDAMQVLLQLMMKFL